VSLPPHGPLRGSADHRGAGPAETLRPGTRMSPPALSPCYLCVDWTRTPAPLLMTMAEHAGRGCPSPEPGTHGRTVTVQPPRGRGRYEGPETFLDRWRHPHGPVVIAAALATGPQYVCGADTFCLDLHIEMNSAHSSRPRHRQQKKVEKIPLTGVVCLLTTGDFISVRWFHCFRDARRPNGNLNRAPSGATDGRSDVPTSRPRDRRGVA
jgi:hypothetical protein